MNIIFDAGGVLFYIAEFRNDIFRRVLRSSGYDNDLIDDGLLELRKFDVDYFSSNRIISWEDEKNWLCNRTKHLATFIEQSNECLFDKLFMLAFDTFQYQLYEETISVLKRMNINHNLYVLSNATASLDWAFDYYDIRRFFKDIVISSYVGFEKPDNRIYNHTLKLIGDEAEDCIFVDDSVENVEAAIECGIQSFHLNRKSGMTLKNFEEYVDSLTLV